MLTKSAKRCTQRYKKAKAVIQRLFHSKAMFGQRTLQVLSRAQLQ